MAILLSDATRKWPLSQSLGWGQFARPVAATAGYPLAVKLCRFDLASAPGRPRSGIVYGGKIYETDGTNPIGIHDWNDVSLLAPIGRPPSVRLFEPGLPLSFRYLNPGALHGPSTILKKPASMDRLSFLPCAALVVASNAAEVNPDRAEEVLLGLSLAMVLVNQADTEDRQSARHYDAGIVLGPVITTPDEVEEAVEMRADGKTYRLTVSVRINGEEKQTFSLADLAASVSGALSHCSESCPLAQGDLVLLQSPEPFDASRQIGRYLERGDEIQLVCDRLGALSASIA